MTQDKLVGGTAKARRFRLRPQPVKNAPPLVGPRFVAIVGICALCLLGLGIYKVDAVFDARDYEMETRRLQELVQKRQDRTKVLESRLSELQRGEVLKVVATESLGMADPSPGEIETLAIPAEVSARWKEAASRVGQPSLEKGGSSTGSQEP